MRRSPWSRVLRVTAFPDRSSVDPEVADRIDTEQALLRLPGDQRLALVLRYFLDLPMDEVAIVMGVSVPAAKSRVRRGLKALEPTLATMRERA
jgi:DNA-directed RNA polymerase specialized sigma24 family protein